MTGTFDTAVPVVATGVDLVGPPDTLTPDTLTPDTLSQRVRRGALWSGATTLLIRFANIAIMIVVARLLVPEDFGIFAVAVTVHAIVSSIGELGVSSCLTRADYDPDKIAPTVATISIVTSVVLAGVMALFAEPLSSALGSPHAAGPMRVLALAVLLVGVFAVPGAQLVREFRQDKQFLATVIGFVPSNALLLLMAAQGGGAMAFAWSRVVGQLVTGLVMVWAVPRHYRPGFDRRVVRSLLLFGLPLAGSNLLSYTLLNADYALIGRMLGSVELGAYLLAFNISSWSTGLLSSMINGVAMPAFTRIKDDGIRLRQSVSRAVRVIALLAFPIAGLSAVLAHPLVEVIYGKRWLAAAPVLAILGVYGAVSILCSLFGIIIVSMGAPRVLLFVSLLWLGALVPAMYVGVKVNGIVGAAVAHLVVIGALIVPIYLIALRKFTSVGAITIWRALYPVLFAAGLSALAAALMVQLLAAPPAQFLVGGLTGGLLYALLVLPMAREYLPMKLAEFPPCATLLGWYDRLPVPRPRGVHHVS
jgi:PST family polysaccharide transporter